MYVLISYPKSGRTWLRLMIGKALCDHFELRLAKRGDILSIQKFWKLDPRIPRFEMSHDGSPFLQDEAELALDKSEYRGKNVILLCRDPRDVVISSWYRREKHAVKYGQPFEGSISEYVRHPIHGVAKVVAFMNVWAANHGAPHRFLLIRYEDMIDAPGKELRRLLEFFGFDDVSDSVVEEAVKYASFENMQTLEREDTLESGRLRPVNPDDPNSFKVRKGQPGGYRDDLDADDVAFVNDVVARKLDAWFGY